MPICRIDGAIFQQAKRSAEAVAATRSSESFGSSISQDWGQGEIEPRYAEIAILSARLNFDTGSFSCYDLLLPGSIWKDPKDFMMAMLKKERVLGAIWEKEFGSIIPDDIKSVARFAAPLGRNKGFASVKYTFLNGPARESGDQKS